jgi:hypothetical protein
MTSRPRTGATGHFTSWLQGQTVDSDAAMADMPAVLALIERSFLAGNSVEAIRLGRAAEGYLSRRQRWAAWGLVLAIILACARDLDDGATEGWALNQLGVRSLGLGRTTEAQRLFEESLAVRERAGDTRGADVTRGNLQTLEHVPPPLPRISHGSPASLVGTIVLVIALLIVGGASIGFTDGDTSANHDDDGAAVVTPPPPGALTVTLAGKGSGSVSGQDFTCVVDTCDHSAKKGTKVTLTAKADKGSRFVGFSGACTGRPVHAHARRPAVGDGALRQARTHGRGRDRRPGQRPRWRSPLRCHLLLQGPVRRDAAAVREARPGLALRRLGGRLRRRRALRADRRAGPPRDRALPPHPAV